MVGGSVQISRIAVFQRSSPILGRSTSPRTASQPVWIATQATKPTGSSDSSATTTAQATTGVCPSRPCHMPPVPDFNSRWVTTCDMSSAKPTFAARTNQRGDFNYQEKAKAGSIICAEANSKQASGRHHLGHGPAVELGGIDPGSLQVAQGHQLFVRLGAFAHSVFEGRTGAQDLL